MLLKCFGYQQNVQRAQQNLWWEGLFFGSTLTCFLIFELRPNEIQWAAGKSPRYFSSSGKSGPFCWGHRSTNTISSEFRNSLGTKWFSTWGDSGTRSYRKPKGFIVLYLFHVTAMYTHGIGPDVSIFPHSLLIRSSPRSFYLPRPSGNFSMVRAS